MKKLLVIGVISSFFSAGAFAAACTVAADGSATSNPSSTTTVGSATAPEAGEQCVCNGGNAGKQIVNGGSGTVIETPRFVKNGFDVQCSNNTVVSYDEVSATAFAVSSGSRKGNQSFIGSSNGGSVTTYKKCTGDNSACTGANVTTAHDAAVIAAQSS
ncbi:MAG: hypothetical protein WA112_07705 [Rugosibacter sp.]|jgi:hypothetical protein